jgi:tRNA(Arg) A34 adenosine deaminase TadA
MDDQSLMQLAIDEAVAGVQAGDGGPFGAVIARGGQIIARGHNRVTSALDPTAHAEVEAIRAACKALGTFDLSGCDLYASCEPCPMCLGATLWSRVDRLFFAAGRLDAERAGFDDAVFYEQLEKPMFDRTKPVTVRLVPESALAPFEAWANKVARVLY